MSISDNNQEDWVRDFVEQRQLALAEKKAEHQQLLESEEYQVEARKLHKTLDDFIKMLTISWHMSTRFIKFVDNSLFMRSIDDLVQSAVAVCILAKDGMRNSARREMRYMVELSIKALYVDQQVSDLSFEDKLKYLDKEVDGTSISPINKISFFFFEQDIRDEFVHALRRAYGVACTYVHPTVKQINERIELVDRGITIGFETHIELCEISREIYFVFSLLLVLVFHAIGSGFTGDIFVDWFDEFRHWEYHKSKYIAAIDAYFDYKHERQHKLDYIRERRQQSIEP